MNCFSGNGFLRPFPNKSKSNIKSIQRGITSMGLVTSITQAISAVNLSNAIIKISTALNGMYDSLIQTDQVTAQITNSTTITFTKTSPTSQNITYVSWEVIEFNNVKSLQVINPSGVGSSTTAISPINTSKAILFCSHRLTSSASVYNEGMLYYSLTNSTTVTCAISLSSDTFVAVIYVIEFY